MSFKRILAFVSWLANKWFGNLFRLPLKFHRECTKDAHGNVFLHIITSGVIVVLAASFMGKAADGEYVGGLPWDILFYCNILHFVYCLIVNQYHRYITELTGTFDRLKDHHE
jgi:hypothetical protein